MKINWETAFNSVKELTDSVLSKTQAAIGPYLSTAFGLVQNCYIDVADGCFRRNVLVTTLR